MSPNMIKNYPRTTFTGWYGTIRTEIHLNSRSKKKNRQNLRYPSKLNLPYVLVLHHHFQIKTPSSINKNHFEPNSTNDPPKCPLRLFYGEHFELQIRADYSSLLLNFPTLTDGKDSGPFLDGIYFFGVSLSSKSANLK